MFNKIWVALLILLALFSMVALLPGCGGGEGSSGGSIGSSGSSGGAGGNSEPSSITQQQAADIYATDNQVSSVANQCYSASNPQQAFQNSAQTIQSMNGVESAFAEGNTLIVKYKNGGAHIWLHNPIIQISATNPIVSSTFTSSKSDIRESVGNKKALIINCIAADPGFDSAKTPLTNTANFLTKNGFAVETADDSNASIDFFKNQLSNYGFILLMAHGCGGYFEKFGGDRIFVQTGQPYNGQNDIYNYYSDWQAGRLAAFTVEWGEEDRQNNHRDFWCISNLFIDEYYKSKGKYFPHSLFYNCACQSLYNNSMASALINSGCSAYLGWTDIDRKGPYAAAQLFSLMTDENNLGNAYGQLDNNYKYDDFEYDGRQIHAQLSYYPSSASTVQLTSSSPTPSPTPSSSPSPTPSPSQSLIYSSSPISVKKGDIVTQTITGATPQGKMYLYWIPPGQSQQGPQYYGQADNSGNFEFRWDTSNTNYYGTYTSWVTDDSTGRVSNQVQTTIKSASQSLIYSSSPASVKKGEIVTQKVTGATPQGRMYLYWIPPGQSQQGPQYYGQADNSGNFEFRWDTSNTNYYGTYTSWITDDSTGRVSNQVQVIINSPSP